MQDAVALLEDTAKHLHDVAGASEAELKRTNRAMLEKTRKAIARMSEAVASQRSSTAKV
ncbi:MAG: hypothetical protein ACLPYS_21050 [Vulcanimicrobiaceae bacterium]